jgi:hypothetical protein
VCIQDHRTTIKTPIGSQNRRKRKGERSSLLESEEEGDKPEVAAAEGRRRRTPPPSEERPEERAEPAAPLFLSQISASLSLSLDFFLERRRHTIVCVCLI